MTQDNKRGLRELMITDPAKHRAFLLLTMEGVIRGAVNVAQANAVASLSAEVHKSIRQQWDMQTYAAENLGVAKGGALELIGSDSDGMETDEGTECPPVEEPV